LDGGVKKKRKRGGHFHTLPPPKRAKLTAWTGKFVGLESKSRSKVPCSVDKKEMLVSAGLGEKTICIADVDCSPQEFRKILIANFPKLDRVGGFELMCWIPNTHHLEPISSPISQQAKLLRSAVASRRIYIRPI